MAGVDTQFDGSAVPMPEHPSDIFPKSPSSKENSPRQHRSGEKAQDVLDRFNELSMKLAEDLSPEEMEKVTQN